MKRSESDVEDLESRQRQLASEKAQVEDARGALQLQASSLAKLAGEQRDCTAQLGELLNRYAAQDYTWVDANADTVNATCNQAGDDFATFQSESAGSEALGVLALVALVAGRRRGRRARHERRRRARRRSPSRT